MNDSSTMKPLPRCLDPLIRLVSAARSCSRASCELPEPWRFSSQNFSEGLGFRESLGLRVKGLKIDTYAGFGGVC